jgi:hypothetical protein
VRQYWAILETEHRGGEVKNSIKIAVIAAAALVVGLVPTAVAQTGAGESPTVSGPFDLVTRDCKSKKARTQEGRAVGDLKSCSFIYQFDPASDGDSSRDYAAIWFQVSANAAKGWCIKVATSTMSPANGTELEAAGPKGKTTPSNPRRYVSKLKLETPGATGRIKQAFRLYPDLLQGRVQNNKHQLFWSGSTGHKLTFAQGIAVSYSQSNKPPELKFGLQPGYEFSDDC